jgi:hypothetical protein
MNLNKEDVERITEGVLANLRLEVDGEPHWTNDRTIKLMLGDREITRCEFSVKSMNDEDRDY